MNKRQGLDQSSGVRVVMAQDGPGRQVGALLDTCRYAACHKEFRDP
jgi:hypothetical protein